MGDEQAVVPQQASSLAVMPVMDAAQLIERHQHLIRIIKSEIWDHNKHSSVLPGTDKETLRLPGAQLLGTYFGLVPRFEELIRIEDWTGAQHGGEPLFYYRYRCVLWYGDHIAAEGIGSCSSWEAKYRFRWVAEEDVPPMLDKMSLRKRPGRIIEYAFAVEKAETAGKFGKPAEYWDRFRQAIAAGKARHTTKETRAGESRPAWEIDATLYRIPNDDVYSLVNTIDKMAQKRAYVGPIITATAASEFFTQDMEDIAAGEEAVIDGTARYVEEDEDMPPPPGVAAATEARTASGQSAPPTTVRKQALPPAPAAGGNGHAKRGWANWSAKDQRDFITQLTSLGLTPENMRAEFKVQSRTQIPLSSPEAFQLVAILQYAIGDRTLNLSQIHEALGVEAIADWLPRDIPTARKAIDSYIGACIQSAGAEVAKEA